MSIVSFKNRNVVIDFPVQVYRNLTRKGTSYSIRQFGKVVGHASSLNLKECVFTVNKKGRERVIRTKRKTVHAYVEGYMCGSNDSFIKRISYNPYLYENFVFIGKKHTTPIYSAEYVYFCEDGVFVK